MAGIGLGWYQTRKRAKTALANYVANKLYWCEAPRASGASVCSFSLHPADAYRVLVCIIA